MNGEVIADRALLLAEHDTVATALEDLEAGTELPLSVGRMIVLSEDVPFGHKVSLAPIGAGDSVYKYGEVIGTATRDIEPGEWVHTHNCESTRGRGDRGVPQNTGGDRQ